MRIVVAMVIYLFLGAALSGSLRVDTAQAADGDEGESELHLHPDEIERNQNWAKNWVQAETNDPPANLDVRNPEYHNGFSVVDYPGQFINNHPHFKKYLVVVAVEEGDASAEHFVKHKTREIQAIADEKGMEVEIVYADPDRVREVSEAYMQIALHLKSLKRDPKVAKEFEATEEAGRLKAVQDYWKHIHVPATREHVKRGFLYGVGLQALVTSATSYFLKGMGAGQTIASTCVVSVFGGVLGVWNATFRRFLRTPDRPGPMYTKMLANSGLFAFALGMVLDPAATLTFFGGWKILEHSGLSQIAKVYITKLLSFREKYGYMSEKSAFFTSQVGVFSIYLLLRLAHLYEIPVLMYGFYAMGPIGFFSYVGYKGYLASMVGIGKRFYSVGDKEDGMIILTEMDKDFREKYIRGHEYQGEVDPEALKRSKLRMIMRVFTYEVLEVGISSGRTIASMGMFGVNLVRDTAVGAYNLCTRPFLPNN